MRKSIVSMVLLGILMLLVTTGCQSQRSITSGRTVSVQGTGMVTVAPDLASFSISVNEIADTTTDAQSLANEKLAQLLDITRSYGILDTDITTTSLTLYPDYTWIDDEEMLLGQRATQEVSVLVKGIDRDDTLLGKLLDNLGIVDNITVSSISFDKEDPSQAYAESRKLAMEKAGQKARDYAVAGGLILGKPISITDSYATDYQTAALGNVMKAFESLGAADYAPTEIPTGELQFSSTVMVVYEMY